MKLPPKTESSVQVKKTLGAGYPASTTALWAALSNIALCWLEFLNSRKIIGQDNFEGISFNWKRKMRVSKPPVTGVRNDMLVNCWLSSSERKYDSRVIDIYETLIIFHNLMPLIFNGKRSLVLTYWLKLKSIFKIKIGFIIKKLIISTTRRRN